MPVSSVTLRSPLLRSMTTSALKFGALFTFRWPPMRRSPPQPKRGCARTSSGATSSGSSRASASSSAGARPGSAALQAMRLQLRSAPSSSARPASSLARNGPSAHDTLDPDLARADPGRRGRGVAAQFELLAPCRASRSGHCAAEPSAPPCSCSCASVRLASVPGGAAWMLSTQAGGSALDSARSARLCAASVPFELQLQRLGRGLAHGQLVRVRPARPAAHRPVCPASSSPWRAARWRCRAAGRWPSSWPWVRRAGQRPLTWALACSAPASRASAPRSSSSRHSGCSRFSAGMSAFSSQRSAAPSSRLPRLRVGGQAVAIGVELQLGQRLAVRGRLQRQVAAQGHAGQAAGLQVRAARCRAVCASCCRLVGRRCRQGEIEIGAGVDAVRPLAPG